MEMIQYDTKVYQISDEYGLYDVEFHQLNDDVKELITKNQNIVRRLDEEYKNLLKLKREFGLQITSESRLTLLKYCLEGKTE